MRLFLLCFFIINPVQAQNYNTYYTSYIYDQSDLSDPIRDWEAIESLQNKKRIEMDLFILDPLRKELTEKKRILNFYHWKRFFFSGLYEVVNAFKNDRHDFYRFDFDEERRQKNETLDWAIPVFSLEEDIIQIENKIKVLENQINEDPLTQLEYLYVCKKPNLPESFQQRIENKLLEMHQSKTNQKFYDVEKAFIESLMSYPTKSQLLSQTSEGYIPALEKSINLLGQFKMRQSIQDEAERLLTQILDANEDGKRFFAYCDIRNLDQDAFETIAAHIAKILDLPFCIIDAAKTTIDDGFLWGNNERKGLLLNVLQTKNPSGKSVLNPILIIKNMDHWMKAKHMPWILKLFDNTPEKFHSSYYDLDIDWGKIHIICAGNTPYDALEPAFNSRTNSFVFEAQ